MNVVKYPNLWFIARIRISHIYEGIVKTHLQGNNGYVLDQPIRSIEGIMAVHVCVVDTRPRSNCIMKFHLSAVMEIDCQESVIHIHPLLFSKMLHQFLLCFEALYFCKEKVLKIRSVLQSAITHPDPRMAVTEGLITPQFSVHQIIRLQRLQEISKITRDYTRL